jgi:hypothetical protein
MSAIRLIGSHHTSHHHGEVLRLADESTVRNNPANVVTLAHARTLVAAGDAEWVGVPPPPEHGPGSGQVAHGDPRGFGAPPGERPEEGDDDPVRDPDKELWSSGVDGDFD